MKKQMLIIYGDDMILAAETKLKGLLDDMCASLTSRFKSRVLGEPMYFWA
jgi:hypothetical protein